jgi:hypothetical protein
MCRNRLITQTITNFLQSRPTPKSLFLR